MCYAVKYVWVRVLVLIYCIEEMFSLSANLIAIIVDINCSPRKFIKTYFIGGDMGTL